MTQRQRVRIACQRCRARRVKCDGEAPCERCSETGLDCAFDHVQLDSKDDMRTEIGRHPIRDGLRDHMKISGASSADVRSATCYRGALSGPPSVIDKDEFAVTTSERNLWAGTQFEANFPVTRRSALGSISLPPPSAGRGKEQRVDPWTRTGWAVAMIRDQLHSLLMADYLPFCLLCEDVFLKDLASGEGRYCSPALVNSLLALASRTWNENQRPHPNQRQQEQRNYHDVADVGSPPSGWWYSQALFDEAEALISGNGPPDTLPDIQTLGMLALYHVSCGRDAEAYELAGSFAAAITELCLREPLAEDEQDEQYAQVRATTYCGAQSLVRMLELLRANSPGIHATILQDDKVNLDQPPCAYRANNPPVPSSTSCQWRQGGHASQLGGLQLIPAKLFQLTEWVYKLIASSQTATSDEVVLVYHRCLKWYESVLAVLKTDRSNSPFVLFIHMYYQFCLLSLFRRYGSLPLEGLSGNPHEIRFQAAQSILGLSKSYVGAITLRRVPPLVPYYVCASGLLSFAIEEAARCMLRVVPLLHFDHGDGAVVETAEPPDEAIRKDPDAGLVGFRNVPYSQV